jgi:hypothetical protein
MKISIITALLLFPTFLFSQGWTEDDEISNRQIGLRIGTGAYGMFGGELKNPRPKAGFQAGLFWFGAKEEKKTNWQTGLEVCLMGSNFKNQDSFGIASSSNYTQIGIIQVEVPLMLSFRLGKYNPKKYKSLQVGLLPAVIVSSVVYVGDDKVPVQQTNLNKWESLPLHPLNLQGVIGYQFRGGIAGMQLRLKASILDLNDNFVLPGLLPATGKGKNIATWGLELGFLF